MGRTLAAVAFLGVLAWAGWWILGRGDASPGDGGAPATDGATAVAVDLAPNSLAENGRPAPESAALRSQIQKGQAGEALKEARAIPTERLRLPDVAAATRDAALAVAAEPSRDPAQRLPRADAARRLLARLAVEDAVPYASVKSAIDALNREVLFARREVPGVVFRWTVKPGDTLDGLMRGAWKGRVHAGYGAVLWLNSVPSPDRLRAGSISVPEEPVRILVRKSTHELWLLLGEVPVRTWPVGLGLGGRTPEGEFEIGTLQPRPDYWPPQGKRIPFGQKGNPLGTRWMGFRDTPEAQGFGIHGTDEPDTIGKDLSQGCVRLRNSDVEQLFTWITVGTRVEIRP
jgi:lipoprotein-anchoring transpeptidase ErfK/SrfK